jgi:DeoR/GlpR family transcriptional regulator of sugar metabolism
MMVDRAQEVFLLVDHTKFEKAGQVFLCDFDSIDHIITDPAFASLEGGGDFLDETKIRLIMAEGI